MRRVGGHARSATAGLAGLVALAGCPKLGPVDPTDVFTLHACGDVPSCAALADGHATTPVELCVRGDQPHAGGLSATLTLSHGSWETPGDPTKPQVLVAALPVAPASEARGTCLDAFVVSPTDVAPVFIDAALGSYTQRACIQMRGPRVDAVVVTSDPTVLSGGDTSVTVTAAPIGDPGVTLPVSGSVMFAVETIVPTSARFALQPAAAPLDATGHATTHLVTSPGTSSVTVTARAQFADGPACPDITAPPDAGVAGSGEVVVPLLPDAAVPDAPPDAPPDAAVIPAP
ncbi:MAG TPA: hypothetical protein VH165_19540 [Kofleriaceae bacterium]|nr:hypothetical protein [Kofleriaceae bacterium]